MSTYAKGKETVCAEGVWLRETEKAALITFVVGGDCWLPKSQFKKEIEILDVDSQQCLVYIPRWLADKCGIRYEEYEPEETESELDLDDDEAYAKMLEDNGVG